MFNAGSTGKDQYLDFIQKRIETNEVDFYAPIKQNKHNTFESTVNMRKVKINGKEVAVRSDRDTFVRLLIMQKTWGIHYKKFYSMSLLLSLWPFQILMLLPHSAKQLKVNCSST